MNQVNKTYVEGMTEEKLTFKCVTSGKHHRSSLTLNFECDDLHHQFVIKRIYHTSVALIDLILKWIDFIRKKVEATDGLKHGQLNSKRRETILRK